MKLHIARLFAFFAPLLVMLALGSCAGLKPTPVDTDPNPAAAGFNAAGSDAQAITIADAVMKALGGRRNWDNTHYISWNFFGRRTLLWDKWTGNVWIRWTGRPQEVVVNINTGKGKVWLNGKEQTQPDTLAKYLKNGREVWINDAYWLVMPYKLKDSGVTLRYIGPGKTDDGAEADVLQLTFAAVGVTPDNKYQVWVDKKSNLITQWAFYKNYNDEKPGFKNRWADYKQYGNILLSGDRGRDGANLYPIEVLTVIPAELLAKFGN
jgi:hypothetical protein